MNEVVVAVELSKASQLNSAALYVCSCFGGVVECLTGCETRVTARGSKAWKIVVEGLLHRCHAAKDRARSCRI